MNEFLHRKAIRAAIMRARSLAANLTKRRGHLPDMTAQELDAFAEDVRSLCLLIEQDRPANVQKAKELAISSALSWHARNALITLLNHEARTLRPFSK